VVLGRETQRYALARAAQVTLQRDGYLGSLAGKNRLGRPHGQAQSREIAPGHQQRGMADPREEKGQGEDEVIAVVDGSEEQCHEEDAE
jgi:hypothetical protein